MMLNFVKGDILLSKAAVLAHGVAPHDHFNQGLALALRERWPAMAKDFRHYCHQSNPKSGEVWLWSGADKRIANLLTQEPAASQNSHPGKASLSHVAHCLKALAQLASKENFTSLALPKLATGVGGLDWGEVKGLIQEYLGSLEIPVIVYENYEAGVEAKEEGL